MVSIVGSFFVRVREGGNPQAALNAGEFGASGIMAVLAFFIIRWMLPLEWIVGGTTYISMGVYYAVLIGLAAGVGTD